MSSLIKELLQKSDVSGSRSTILKPLTWLISSIFGGIILLLKIDSPNWIIVMFLIVIGVALIIFFFTYLFCLFTDKDAIRSEKYSIQKMAIEKGVYGDNTVGVVSNKNFKNIESNILLTDSEEIEGNEK